MTRLERCIDCKLKRLETLDQNSREFIELSVNIVSLVLDGYKNDIVDSDYLQNVTNIVGKKFPKMKDEFLFKGVTITAEQKQYCKA
jgi:glycosylphosphatidylinositol transamidase (GPIT) subunit GPI8